MLEQVIGRDDDIDIVGVASGGEQALDMIDRHRPDVATIDIAMPGMSGLALVELVLSDSVCVPVVVSSMHLRRQEAIRRGAFGFFDKTRVMADSGRLIGLIKAAGRSEQNGAAAEDVLI